MSDDADDDKSSKTEEPTERRLDQARERGNIPISREVGTLLMVLSIVVVLSTVMPQISRNIATALLPFLENPADFSFGEGRDAWEHLARIMVDIGVAVLPMMAIMILGAIGAAFGQGEVRASLERVTPKFSHVNPLSGLSRIFSWNNVFEFIKGSIKVTVIGWAVWNVVWPEIQRMGTATDMMAESAFTILLALVLRMFGYVLAALIVITIVDLIWKRLEWRKSLRMSRRELKDEFKDTEGDPQIKARVRQIQRERAKKRMMTAVPTATVVITNPTHFAVALRYERGKDDAPVCVAKGMDNIALKIREIAKDAKVPVIENPPLARALYKVVEVDQPIPYEHFKAVADVITYIYNLKNRRK